MHLSSSDKEGILFSQHLDPLAAPLSRGNSACRDKFDMDNIHDFWPAFSLPTPPTSPVDMCNACHEASKEIGWHLARSPWAELREIEDDELEVNDLPFEGYGRELTGLRAKSPAILNDIMWSGDRVKRPDSTTDFLARFSLVSASSSIDQAVNHSLADADELFSCTLTTPCSDQQLTTEALARPESGVSFDFPLYEQSSDTGIFKSVLMISIPFFDFCYRFPLRNQAKCCLHTDTSIPYSNGLVCFVECSVYLVT